MVNNNDRFIPVATFRCVSEAHLAKHMLEAEGIASLIEGIEAGGTLNGLGLSDHIRVHVLAQNAGRAALLLADVQSRAELPADWEDEAERGHVCSLCGEPVEEAVMSCPMCKTPYDAIRGAPSPSRSPATSEAVQSPSEDMPAKRAMPEMADVTRPAAGCLSVLLWWLPIW